MFVDNLSEVARPTLKANRQRKENIGAQAMDPEIRARVQRMAPDMVRSPGKESVHVTVPAPIIRSAARDADKGRVQVVGVAADNKQGKRSVAPAEDNRGCCLWKGAQRAPVSLLSRIGR
jgi:hypothetical protein